ncbi:hypothetical protein AB0G86_18870 [Streptomyces scabiei]|uniref:hypothetical protein n=1 Tax=Streptomyces scabiei TaxID=1930 RepID=UPI0033F89583
MGLFGVHVEESGAVGAPCDEEMSGVARLAGCGEQRFFDGRVEEGIGVDGQYAVRGEAGRPVGGLCGGKEDVVVNAELFEERGGVVPQGVSVHDRQRQVCCGGELCACREECLAAREAVLVQEQATSAVDECVDARLDAALLEFGWIQHNWPSCRRPWLPPRQQAGTA